MFRLRNEFSIGSRVALRGGKSKMSKRAWTDITDLPAGTTGIVIGTKNDGKSLVIKTDSASYGKVNGENQHIPRGYTFSCLALCWKPA